MHNISIISSAGIYRDAETLHVSHMFIEAARVAYSYTSCKSLRHSHYYLIKRPFHAACDNLIDARHYFLGAAAH